VTVAVPETRLWISVVVPSFQRPQSLRRTLDSLMAQTRRPDEIAVGARAGDERTRTAVEQAKDDGIPVVAGYAARAGVVAAMTAALEQTVARSDVIALLDDDATAFPDYIERIEHAFSHDASLGGFGGRDWQPFERGNADVVGKVQWFGRVVGAHHLGHGPAREVDTLKGVCSAYRAAPLRAVGFGTYLRGDGAQYPWELALGFAIKRQGFRLVYDPALAVDHHIEPRQGADQYHRGTFVRDAMIDASANETLAILEYFPPVRRLVFIAWAVLVGPRGLPGLLQVPRLLLKGEGWRGRELLATWQGRVEGIKAYLRRRSAR